MKNLELLEELFEIDTRLTSVEEMKECINSEGSPELSQAFDNWQAKKWHCVEHYLASILNCDEMHMLEMVKKIRPHTCDEK